MSPGIRDTFGKSLFLQLESFSKSLMLKNLVFSNVSFAYSYTLRKRRGKTIVRFLISQKMPLAI